MADARVPASSAAVENPPTAVAIALAAAPRSLCARFLCVARRVMGNRSAPSAPAPGWQPLPSLVGVSRESPPTPSPPVGAQLRWSGPLAPSPVDAPDSDAPSPDGDTPSTVKRSSPRTEVPNTTRERPAVSLPSPPPPPPPPSTLLPPALSTLEALPPPPSHSGGVRDAALNEGPPPCEAGCAWASNEHWVTRVAAGWRAEADGGCSIIRRRWSCGPTVGLLPPCSITTPASSRDTWGGEGIGGWGEIW